mgnify:CR=1 FL=1
MVVRPTIDNASAPTAEKIFHFPGLAAQHARQDPVPFFKKPRVLQQPLHHIVMDVGNKEIGGTGHQLLRTSLNRKHPVTEAVQTAGGEMLITADHGNAEQMVDPKSQQPHTAHTLNPVPLIYVGNAAPALMENGALCDVAPTLLQIMGLPQPAAMTGRSLLLAADADADAA